MQGWVIRLRKNLPNKCAPPPIKGRNPNFPSTVWVNVSSCGHFWGSFKQNKRLSYDHTVIVMIVDMKPIVSFLQSLVPVCRCGARNREKSVTGITTVRRGSSVCSRTTGWWSVKNQNQGRESTVSYSCEHKQHYFLSLFYFNLLLGEVRLTISQFLDLFLKSLPGDFDFCSNFVFIFSSFSFSCLGTVAV